MGKLSDRFKAISEAPQDIKAIVNITVITLVIAVVALAVASLSLASVRHAN